MPDERRPVHDDHESHRRRARSPINFASDPSDAAQRASRLLDVSPPHFGMSGFTSDSDFGPPQTHGSMKRREHSAHSTRDADAGVSQRQMASNQQSRSASDGHDLGVSAPSAATTAATDDADEWDFSELHDSDNQQSSPSMPHGAQSFSAPHEKPSPLHISVTPSGPSESEMSRGRASSDTSSSLDPYYYGFTSSREGSPNPPPLPDSAVEDVARAQYQSSYASRSRNSIFEPQTPSRDPSSIDRHGLIGVGELSTPRWASEASSASSTHQKTSPAPPKRDNYEHEDVTPSWGQSIFNDPQSLQELENLHLHDYPASAPLPPLPSFDPPARNRYARGRESSTEESGGEEILYKPPVARAKADSTWGNQQKSNPSASASTPSFTAVGPSTSASNVPESPTFPLSSTPSSPPSSFSSHPHKAKKRTSEEFERDQFGVLTSKMSGVSLHGTGTGSDREERERIARRHRSTGVGSPALKDRPRDRRRTDSTGMSSLGRAGRAASHSHQGSTSSVDTRRVFSSDFGQLASSASMTTPPASSRLRPSESNASGGYVSTDGDTPRRPTVSTHHSSPSVAHSILRGTQEGWAALDDSATVEALRKLDGISGRSLRGRSSVGSSSRPATPASRGGLAATAWEGREALQHGREGGHNQTHGGDPHHERDHAPTHSPRLPEAAEGEEKLSGPEDPSSHTPHFIPSKHSSKDFHAFAARTSNYALKRGSASSASATTGTPTTSSRDSIILSTTTSATSTSALSHRNSGGKLRRSSGGSDISSVNSEFFNLKDRAAALANGEGGDDSEAARIPPVPPLPKAYQSPSAASFNVQPLSPRTATPPPMTPGDEDHTFTIPTIDLPPATPGKTTNVRPHTQPQPSPRGPTKKWSFSNALNLKSPGRDKESPKSPTTPRRGKAGRQSTGSSQTSSEQWSVVDSPKAPPTISPSYLHASPSISSLQPINDTVSPTPTTTGRRRSPDRSTPSRTESSASTQTTSQAMRSRHSPSSKGPPPTNKRLTPSNIPFFRRSSSASMKTTPVGSPPQPAYLSHHASNISISTTASKSTNSLDIISPTSSDHPPIPHATRKSSVLNLLKGGSSRKSVIGERTEHRAVKEEREKEKESSIREEPVVDNHTPRKKDDKERSESRISRLMGRQRGKTVSSGNDPKTQKPVAALPPMQMSALSSSTASRVASLKAKDSKDSVLMPPPMSSARSRASVASLTPRSPGNKASDSSLRSTRHNLPPIAGSPSVGSHSSHPPVSGYPRSSMDTKETPTKIPRISSRSSTLQSPAVVAAKSSTSTVTNASRRTSMIVPNTIGTKSVDPSPSPHASLVSDFGVLEGSDSTTTHQSTYAATTKERGSARNSPQPVSRGTKPSIMPIASSSRKAPMASESFVSLRKSSAPTISHSASTNPSDSHTLSSKLAGLTPSKSFKLLSPKVSLPVTRTSPAISQITPATPGSGRQSVSTPSPVSSSAEDDEAAADEEMLAYIKRHQARKIANGAKKEELEDLLRFPDPIAPIPASSPASLLRSSQATHLAPFEKSEVLDFPKVYYIGAHSEKVQATPEIPANNYGYDDERGDYLVINGDHLAYRYEIIDVLGKGSFGQVLQCRDHATGESVAVKIIRNKKRFHHQALIEIKILENLKKWDPENKHHVIMMNEHFYFRDHLCIVMELLSMNLYELIKANQFAGFSTVLIRRFTTQMLSSLVLMRLHRVVHCDLKPENVLLKHPAKSALKVIDFGSSCFEHEKVYTYIQSRFYRSPEVILGLNYHMAIDMWSLGCILAELYTGYPIFPGENEQEQLACIMEVLGVPDKDLVARSSRKNLFFDRTGAPRPVVNSRGKRRRAGSKTLAQVLRCDEENFIDFIARCLHWDPERRLKPQNALRHPFITSGRRKPPVSSTPASRSLLASSSSSRVKSSSILETPKKTQIGAPTPLAARTPASRLAPGASVPATPITSSATMQTLSSSTSQSARHRSAYRTDGTSGLSYHQSARNLTNGYSTASTSAK